jgi:hypothetical protein
MEVWIFFSAAPTAQNSSRLNFHIGNVSLIFVPHCWLPLNLQAQHRVKHSTHINLVNTEGATE